MGTSNFLNRNARRIYAVLMDSEEAILDDEGNETDETEYRSADEWEYEDLKDNLINEFKVSSFKFHEGGVLTDNNRNFHGTLLGKLSSYKDYLGVEVGIEIKAIIRSGYYEGANLDWELEYSLDGYDADEIEYAIAEWEYQANKEFNLGLVKMNSKNVEAWITTEQEKLIEEVERIFAANCGIKLQKVATFSNGETIYKEVE